MRPAGWSASPPRSFRLPARVRQADLFESSPPLPDGLRYQADFLTIDEEAELLQHIATLPLREARYKQYTARRRTVSFGSGYDFGSNALRPAPPIPDWLLSLRDRAAEWIVQPAQAFAHALVTEYQPGTALGWHRDVPDFCVVVGISLAGWARMRFRPHPPQAASRLDPFALDLAPRSAYVLQGEARWRWQHAVSPTKGLRYSITFRTMAAQRPGGKPRLPPEPGGQSEEGSSG
jgi:alkylated DNA repair dioxygenase AlkB